MSALGDSLEAIHKRIEASMNPFTMMLTRRKFSPRLMNELAGELEMIAKEIRNICDGH